MKPSVALIAAAGLVAAVAGCGQPGPLYMPKPPAKPVPTAPIESPPATGYQVPPELPTAAPAPNPTPTPNPIPNPNPIQQ